MVALYLHTASHTQTDYTPHNCMNTKWLQLPVGSFYRLSLWETIQRIWQFVTNTTSSTTNHQTIEMLNDIRLTEAPVVKAHEQIQGLFLVSYGDSLYQIKNYKDCCTNWVINQCYFHCQFTSLWLQPIYSVSDVVRKVKEKYSIPPHSIIHPLKSFNTVQWYWEWYIIWQRISKETKNHTHTGGWTKFYIFLPPKILRMHVIYQLLVLNL